MRDLIEREVLALLAESFCTEPGRLHPQTRLVEDLYADSLDLLDLVLELNDRFGIEIDAASLEQMRCVQQVVTVVQRLTLQAAAV